MEYWDDLLHLAASIQTRTVAPSTILKRLAASRNPSQLARALRELGRLERTLFMIEWYSDPALRRRCQAGLNKGEAAHKLKRAVFFHGHCQVNGLRSQSPIGSAGQKLTAWPVTSTQVAKAQARARR
jgi:TnpA family transposase